MKSVDVRIVFDREIPARDQAWAGKKMATQVTAAMFAGHVSRELLIDDERGVTATVSDVRRATRRDSPIDREIADELHALANRLGAQIPKVRRQSGELGRVNDPISLRLSEIVVELQDLIAGSAPSDWTTPESSPTPDAERRGPEDPNSAGQARALSSSPDIVQPPQTPAVEGDESA